MLTTVNGATAGSGGPSLGHALLLAVVTAILGAVGGWLKARADYRRALELARDQNRLAQRTRLYELVGAQLDAQYWFFRNMASNVETGRNPTGWSGTEWPPVADTDFAVHAGDTVRRRREEFKSAIQDVMAVIGTYRNSPVGLHAILLASVTPDQAAQLEPVSQELKAELDKGLSDALRRLASARAQVQAAMRDDTG